MAIAKMSHIRLIGLKRDRNKILDVLTSDGLFEPRAADELSFKLGSGGADLYGKLKLKQSRVEFALDFLKARRNFMADVLKKNRAAVKAGKAEPIDFELPENALPSSRILITRADFSDAAAREYDLMHVCDSLQKLSFDIVEASSRINALDGVAAAYMPFAAAPIKLSELDRDGDIKISLFYGKSAKSPSEQLSDLPCAYEVMTGDGYTVLTVCRAKDRDEVEKPLVSSGYVMCAFSDDCTAAQKIDAVRSEQADINRHIFELSKQALSFQKEERDLRILYDVIGAQAERAEAEQKFAQTGSVFVSEGWIPERVAEKKVAELKERCPGVFVQLLAPEERDAPPTLAENNRVVKPYEQITDMYSSPHYREIDPNPIMSIFYFLFFGIMIGDAGYGLVLAIAGLTLGNMKRFDIGIRRLALLIGMGGVSAIIWGILFGGYFSIDFGDTQVALLLNPLDKPLLLLVLSLAFGVLQLSVGFIIKFVALCKEGKPFSAIFDCGSILLLFISLVLLVFGNLPSLAPMLGITVSFTPPEALNTAALVCACAGVALILFFGGRNGKSVFSKAVGGFKGLYGLVNLLSDLLSYCRLFGLCLASCAIGLAFNSLGEILMGIPVAGYVVGGIVLAVLHLFNLGLGVLSAYVHDARLQFLEFYGKFYEGGGRPFAPLGGKTRYIRYN